MPKLYNRARVTVASTGTGTLTLSTAVAGYQTFTSAGVQNNDVVSYVIEDGLNWEVGTGTYTTSTNTLTRTVTQSFNGSTYGTTAISVTASAQVFISPLAADLVVPNGAVTLPVANGGTGVTSIVAGRVPYGAGTGALGSDANLFWNSSTSALGIGTSSPATYGANIPTIDLEGTSGGGVKMGTGTASFGLYYNAGSGLVQTFDSSPLLFVTNNSERARIDINGNFLVGTSTASGKFYAVSNANGVVGRIEASATSSYTSEVFQTMAGQAAGTGFKVAAFYTGAGAAYAAYVRGDGAIFAQNTTIQAISDARLKENIRDASDGIETILALRPRRFDWKEGYGCDRKNQLGFIAQEVEAVFPDAVDIWDKSEDENNPYKSVGAGMMIPVLVKAVQELAAEVAALKEQLNA